MTTKSKRSISATVQRRSRDSSITLRERRRSHSSKKSIEEDEFTSNFKFYCLQQEVAITPNIKIVPSEPIFGEFPIIPSIEEISTSKKPSLEPVTTAEIPNILVVYVNEEGRNIPQVLLVKHFILEHEVLMSIKMSLDSIPGLTILKLEFCHLTHKEIFLVKKILARHATIQELSVNGNPNRYQNFYALLKTGCVAQISMRFCKINDRGLKGISEQLSKFDHPLTVLNLSSNFITDEGVVHLAKALRVNRSLICINLADNWLTDEGCAALMKSLQKFPLAPEEISIRRCRKIDYLIKKMELVLKSSKIDYHKNHISEASSLHSQSSNSVTRKASPTSSKILKKDSKPNQSARKSSKSSTGSVKERSLGRARRRSNESFSSKSIEELVLLELGQDQHPFIKDAYTELGLLYCKGNFKLIHLNLGYNRIDSVGVKSILDTVQYQKAWIESDEGIASIVLEANVLPEYSVEINEVNELLYETRRGSSASTESQRRKRSSSSGVRIAP